MKKEQNIDEVAKEWDVKPLGELCERVTKGGTPTTYGFAFVNQGINFIKIENIDSGRVNVKSIRTFISSDAHNYQKKSQLQKNDLLFSIAGTIGETCLIKEEYLPANTNQALAILRGYDKYLKPQFLTYQLNSSIAQMVKSKARGGAMNNISLEDLKAISITVPTLNEQQQIVSKIEELFSELDKGIDELKTAQKQLKVYRQAVLKWAFENDLEGKGKMILSEVADKIQIGPFGTQLHKEDYIEGGIPLINPMHLQDGMIVPNMSYSIKLDKRDSLPNYILQEGDVILGRRGEMARCGLVTKYEDGWFCGTGSLYVRPDKRQVDSKFLYHLLKSESTKKYLEDNAGGTTMANLNLKIVNNVPLHLPTLKEQQQIVQEIESRLSVCDKIEETITNSLKQSEALRQSILKKAFEGKLL